MFRVKNIYKNLYITVRGKDGELIKKIMRPHLAPGEMEQISLKTEEIAKCNGVININLEEVI